MRAAQRLELVIEGALMKHHAATPIAIAILGVAAVAAPGAYADEVIPDDLVVQGNLCVGTACANPEPFASSNIRLKGPAPRIDFLDVSAVPSVNSVKDWRIEINSSANNENYFAIKDLGNDGSVAPSVGLTPILKLTGGARINSIVVGSTGNVGLGTATPARELHVVGGSSPTMRLQQDASRGQPQRTWEVGANQTRFFLRDLGPNASQTKTPFSVFAGAPDNAMQISAAGNVGIGVSPSARLHTTGSVRFAGVANCASGIRSNSAGTLSCITSSRQFKTITGDLMPETALANVMALRPKVGAYKDTPDEPEHWLIAEEAAEVDPAFVGLQDGAPYTVKMHNVVPDLVAVIQGQQRKIERQDNTIDMQHRQLAEQRNAIAALAKRLAVLENASRGR
jgi:hypothetical protein